MKKKLLSLLLLGGLTLTAGAQYQVPNSDFEQWETVTYTKTGLLGATYTGDEPVSWNSFLDGTGSLKGTAGRDQVDKVADKRPGSTGTYSAKITARSVLGVVAQGNLTTGCVNMGGYDATDANGNYNYSNISDGKCQKFTGRPDAMRVWVKYSSSQENYQAKANAILHTDGYYQDPIGNSITATLVAKAENLNIDNTGAWQELTIPFAYNVSDRPAYALVSFATSNTPGKGNKDDSMLIDDLEFLYYSQLSDLTYNGTTIAGFNKDTYSYTVDGYYSTNCLVATKNCAGGEIVYGDYNATNRTITITVKGDNISEVASNYHTYTITFTKDAVTKLSSQNYTDFLRVAINGNIANPQETIINVSKFSDNTYTLSLDNFILVDGEEMYPVGNIVLEGLTATEADGFITFDTKQTIQIQPGTIEGTTPADWMGPTLGDVLIEMVAKITPSGKMYCTIDIDMTEALGQVINVYFGVVNNLETEALPDAEGVHVVLNRTFQPGWSTVFLQYDVTMEELGAVKVMQFDRYDRENDVLKFTEVASGNMSGNYPYLVKFDAEKVNPFFANRRVRVWNTLGGRYSDIWSFKGTFTGIANMEGKYGVTANIDGSQYIRRGGKNASIKGTRAYFECSDDSRNVQQMRIQLDGENGATSIDGVQVLSGSFDIYNLQGICVRTAATSLEDLTPGVYVVNGKKVMVK